MGKIIDWKHTEDVFCSSCGNLFYIIPEINEKDSDEEILNVARNRCRTYLLHPDQDSCKHCKISCCPANSSYALCCKLNGLTNVFDQNDNNETGGAVKCPFCGTKKELMTLVSGNTFGAVYWSDNKRIAPMLPTVSPVQKCSNCGSTI